MKKWQKIQYYAENFVLLVVQGFIDSFFMLYFTYVSLHRYRRTIKIIQVSVTNPVTGRRTSTERPVTA